MELSFPALPLDVGSGLVQAQQLPPVLSRLALLEETTIEATGHATLVTREAHGFVLRDFGPGC